MGMILIIPCFIIFFTVPIVKVRIIAFALGMVGYGLIKLETKVRGNHGRTSMHK